jgi:hypothetical protein
MLGNLPMRFPSLPSVISILATYGSNPRCCRAEAETKLLRGNIAQETGGVYRTNKSAVNGNYRTTAP